MTRAERLRKDTSVVWVLPVCLLLMAGIVPMIFCGLGQLALTLPSQWLMLSLMLYTSSRLSWIIAVGSRGPLLICFFLFSYVFVALPGLAQELHNYFPLGGIFTEQTRIYACLTLMLGILCYDFGRVLASGRQRHKLDDIRVPKGWTLSSDKVWLLLIGSIPLTLVSILAVGGIGAFFGSRNDLAASVYGAAPSGVKYYQVASKAQGTIILSLAQVPVFVALYAWLVRRGSKISPLLACRERNHKPLVALGGLCIPIVIALNVIVNNPLSNARFWVGTIAISLFLAAAPLNSASRCRLFVTGVLVSCILLFPYAEIFRHSSSTVGAPAPISSQFLTLPDFDLYQEHLRALQYVGAHGFAFGRQLLAALLFWIPRGLWPGKPVATGSLVAAAIGQPGLVASSLWSEAFVDFGAPGIVIYFSVLGRLSSKLDEQYEKSLGGGVLTGSRLAVPLLAGYEFYFLRGSLVPAVSRLVVLLAVAALVYRRAAPAVSAGYEQNPRISARSARPRVTGRRS